MKIVDILAALLLIIGGLNWGLFGLLDVNFISYIFEQKPLIAKLIFMLIGLAAVYQIVQWKAIRDRWRHRPLA